MLLFLLVNKYTEDLSIYFYERTEYLFEEEPQEKEFSFVNLTKNTHSTESFLYLGYFKDLVHCL